jgi:hypothetical protein
LIKNIENNQKSIGKPIPTYGFEKSQEKICEKKFETFAKYLSRNSYARVWIENRLKILAYEFLFFVIFVLVLLTVQ